MRKILILLLALTCAVQANESKKNLELGVGLLSMSLNHYRGSDQSKIYAIPYPYFYYKSKRIEAEPSYFHGILHKNDLFSIRISVLAGLKVDSTENRARAGMPGLGYTLEAGPMFFSTLWKSPNKQFRLDLGIPFRQVFATDFSSYFDHLGSFAIPFLNFIIMPDEKNLNIRHEFSVAAMWGSQGYHRYYYQVASKYATASRPVYDPGAGYTGFNIMWLAEKRFKHFTLVPFVRYDNLVGAVYKDSPLVKSKKYLVVALMTNYLL